MPLLWLRPAPSRPPSVTGFPGVAFTMTMRCVRVGVRRAVRWKDAVYLMKKDSRLCVCVCCLVLLSEMSQGFFFFERGCFYVLPNRTF